MNPVTVPDLLWRDYWVLTQEMAKFLEREDLDMFNNIIDQRGKLQERIEEANAEEFLQTPEGQLLGRQIRQKDQEITTRLQLLLNREKQQHSLNQAYENIQRQTAPRVGGFMDRQG